MRIFSDIPPLKERASSCQCQYQEANNKWMLKIFLPIYVSIKSRTTKHLWTNKRTNKNENPTRHLNTALHHTMNENRNCKKNSRLLKAETQHSDTTCRTSTIWAEDNNYSLHNRELPHTKAHFRGAWKFHIATLGKTLTGRISLYPTHLQPKTKAITSHSWPSIRCHKDSLEAHPAIGPQRQDKRQHPT